MMVCPNAGMLMPTNQILDGAAGAGVISPMGF